MAPSLKTDDDPRGQPSPSELLELWWPLLLLLTCRRVQSSSTSHALGGRREQHHLVLLVAMSGWTARGDQCVINGVDYCSCFDAWSLRSAVSSVRRISWRQVCICLIKYNQSIIFFPSQSIFLPSLPNLSVFSLNALIRVHALTNTHTVSHMDIFIAVSLSSHLFKKMHSITHQMSK